MSADNHDIAIGYVRVSTIEQAEDGVSLAAQQMRLRANATAHQLDVRKVHADEGVSGKTTATRLYENGTGLAALDEQFEGYKPIEGFGFKLDTDGRTLIEDEDEQATIERMTELRAAGLSWLKFGKTLDAKGRQPKNASEWSPKTVRTVLTRQSLKEAVAST